MLLILGSIGLDTIETPSGRYNDILGGSASYASLSASLLAPVSMISVIGQDFPEKYKTLFRKHAIDITGLHIAQEPTFRWDGYYKKDMNTAYTRETQLGALAHFKPALNDKQKQAEYIFLGNIDPSLQINIIEQTTQKKFIALDSMNFWIDSKPEVLLQLLNKIDLLFLNETEIHQLTQTNNISEAITELRKKGVLYVVIKQGSEGACFAGPNDMFTTKAYPVKQVQDPTGAGDSFAGAFMSFLYNNMYIQAQDHQKEAIMKQALVWGAVVASSCVEQFSVKGLTDLTKSEIEKRYQYMIDLTQ